MPDPIGSYGRARNMSSIDDFPNQSSVASPPAKTSTPANGVSLEGGYTSKDGSTGVARDTVNKLVASVPKPSAKPAPRSAAQCGDKAVKTAVVCAGGLAGAVAAATTVVGAFVAGGAAGFACADSYADYTDCLEGKK